jgi:CRP-like cAMP-binding protein
MPQLGHDRRSEARRLIDAMEHAKTISDGQFSALGMLITDASLCADEPALVEVQDGLQWLHRTHFLDTPALDGDQREQRGRVLGLIDTVHWALRRLPSGLQLSLHPEGHAARFLVAVARRQGLSNQQLAAELGTDETEISRVGRKLLAAGVVWRRKEWRHNAWDITPRGLQYAENAGLLKDRDREREEPVAASARSGEGRPEPAGRARPEPSDRRGLDPAAERADRSERPAGSEHPRRRHDEPGRGQG